MSDKYLFLARLEEWIRQNIPLLNNAIETGNLGPDELVSAFQPWIAELREKFGLDFDHLSREEARRLIQLVGFGISSVERHYQAQRHVPGIGLTQLPGVDDALVKLSQVARHPPRDSHYTYWKWNAGKDPLTFTGDPQEVFFNQAVNHTDELHSDSCDALRPICQGDLPITSPDAIAALQRAAQNTTVLYEHFLSFMAKDKTLNRRAMEPWFFMTRMRTYLPTYPVNGILWEGVNAANLASQMQLDYLGGTVKNEYADTVRERFRFLTDEDRDALEADMSLPSVVDVLLEQMRLSRRDVEIRGDHELAFRIAAQPPALRNALVAYKSFFEAASQLTTMHWALIKNYLDKPAAKLTEDERTRLAVQPEKGTGGKTREQTKAIMNMRREHPIISKLSASIELADGREHQQAH